MDKISLCGLRIARSSDGIANIPVVSFSNTVIDYQVNIN